MANIHSTNKFHVDNLNFFSFYLNLITVLHKTLGANLIKFDY